MEPESSNQHPPLGQPINPNPGDPEYTPQPMAGDLNKPGKTGNKKLWTIIGSAVVALLLVFGLAWWLSQGAKEEYAEAAAVYKQEITKERDALNADLENNNLSGSDAGARPFFEEHGIKLQQIVANEPKTPKVLLFIPVPVDSATKQDVADLSKAATNYANALLEDAAIYNYYTTVTGSFRPIKEIGVITVFNEDKIKELGELWPPYLETLKSTQPPDSLKDMHADLIEQNIVIDQKIKEVNDNLDTNSQTQTDELLVELGELTKTATETFNEGVAEASKTAFETVNATYEELDALL